MGLFDRFTSKDPVEKMVQDVVKYSSVIRLTDNGLTAGFVAIHRMFKDEEIKIKITNRLRERCQKNESIGLWHICTDIAIIKFGGNKPFSFEFEIMQATAFDLQKMGVAEGVLDGQRYSLLEFQAAERRSKELL